MDLVSQDFCLINGEANRVGMTMDLHLWVNKYMHF